MFELTAGFFGFLIAGELILSLIAIGFFLDENDGYGFSLFLFLFGLIFPILIFEDLTFSQTIQYLPYYGIGSVVCFFTKWVLTLWRTGSELKGKAKEDLKYDHKRVRMNKDGSFSMVQPSFTYLVSHAIAFPLSIIATFFDTILLNLYNLFKLQMQNLADWFLPKELR